MKCVINTKKAQITIFVIIAILIVAGIVIFFSLKKTSPVKELPVSVTKAKNGIDSCLDLSVKKAINFISSEGGYFLPEKNIINWQGIDLALYYNRGKINIPSEKEVSSSISKYISLDLPSCSEDALLDYDYSFGDIKAETTISRGKVYVKITYPITIREDNSSYSINKFEKTTPSKLYELYDFSKKITTQYVTNETCLTCIANEAEKNNFEVKMLDYLDSLIFTVIDKQSNAGFTFAVRM